MNWFIITFMEITKKPSQSDFWKRVDFLLEYNSMNIGQLCRKIKVKSNIIYHQRSLGITPKLEQANLMAKALKTTIDYLANGSNGAHEIDCIISYLLSDSGHYMYDALIPFADKRSGSQLKLVVSTPSIGSASKELPKL